jgi:lipid II:glycine glycyltransferase (peptidoglycan interpeptide bridge formation enzyme)
MTRSRESFTKQADVARNGEAFFVVVKDNDTGMIVGMLLVSCYKNAAYDNSVAIDPDFAQRYVGHLLKWRAIEELQKRNIPTYELGQIAREDASVKEKGINHFKEGWSRGNTRVLWVLEKTLDLT